MQKTSALSDALRILTGAGLGGALGYYVNPELFGYQDVPAARRTSATMNAILGGALTGIGRKNLGAMFSLPKKVTSENIGPTIARMSAPGVAVAGAETIPIIQAGLHQQREASRDIAQAAKEQSRFSIPGSIQQLLSSNIGRGAGVGAAGAGLASILTGLGRRQTEEEQLGRTSRGSMVAKDFLKYLIPAILAGGIAGSFVPERQ